ncbi:MAG: glycosyl hydrolase [Saprospiraceae bacterium]|nr:glycosyl hydrolase [Saprospiraceae bacterium]
MKRLLFVFSILAPFLCFAQTQPTPAADRLKAFQQRKDMQANSLLATLEAQSIGPSIFSCRVTDVEANPADPADMYVAYASGGLWRTRNNGTRFEPVFDHEASMTIGDIAVDWGRNVVWVGAGENNSSRSSYAGTGIYRSADGGNTWEHRGLPESHHIGRIALHPTNPNVLWVAVLGHLYSPNPERGVYRSTDGGNTWTRTLYVDDNSGAIDLVVDPGNADVLYAATWQRDRRAWHFNGAGEGSGIWKSIDGGQTWSRLNTPASGFPNGKTVGRIGLTAGRKDGKTVLYASLDNQAAKPKKEEPKPDALTKDQLRTMSVADFDKLADDKIEQYLRDNDFPEKYTAEIVRKQVKDGKITPLTLVEYLEDANTRLFEANYIGAEVYRSDDNGQSWYKTHTEPLDNIHFTYGYYFSNVRCAPDNPDKVYLLGFFIVRSDDGGKTWRKINGDNVHVDHHALWVNPLRDGHLINGNDGGLNISWDDGASWMLCNNPPVGQLYAVAADEAEPYNVYGGAQDNGVWVGPSNYKASDDWQQEGRYPYQRLLGGDGMQIAIDTRDNNTVYTGFQFGNYFRMRRTGGKPEPVKPKHDLGERPPRFNWQTPIHLSRHNQDILYLGAHKLYRSFDQGAHWEAISGDLTRGAKEGNVPYGTLTSIHESPLQFGLLYAGSDDGLVHVTRDGGLNWKRVSDTLPKNLWVSRVIASAHEKARAYVTLNGYRDDNFTPYLFTTENYGATWTRLGTDLPLEPVNVVREDPANPDLLYVGTDHGLYISLDRGRSFQAVSKGLPDVPVHDLAVQANAKDLIAGTHGRSIYKIPVGHLQAMTAAVLAKSLHLFPPASVKHSPNWGKKRPWEETKDPDQTIAFYSKTAGKTAWRVETEDGILIRQGETDARAGLNYFAYGLDVQEDAATKLNKKLEKADPKAKLQKADSGKYYLPKGKYKVVLKQGTTMVSEVLEVR